MDKIQKKAQKLGQALKATGEKSEQRNLKLAQLEESIRLMEDEAKLYEEESRKLFRFVTKETALYFSFVLMALGSLLVLLSFL